MPWCAVPPRGVPYSVATPGPPAMPQSAVLPRGVPYWVATPGPIHSKSFTKIKSIIILTDEPA